jgi:DNA-binding NarL/FixJ family response regulator
VLLVDDHPVVRTGLRIIAEVNAAITVVGEAANAAEALLAVRELQPDVLLLDVRLPDRSGLEVCRELKAARNGPRVLFLTSFADNQLVLAAMQAGGDGYLLKDNEPRDIVAAIRKVMRGETMFDPVVTRAVERELKSVLPKAADPLAELSDQERRVLAEVAAGKTDKDIATTLNLQPKTVRNYLERVFEKLGVTTRTQAAVLFDRQQRP